MTTRLCLINSVCLNALTPSILLDTKSELTQKMVVYAQKHNYHLEFDWVGDGLITNTTVRLEDLIDESLATAPDPEKVDMILTPDWFVSSLPHPIDGSHLLTLFNG